MHYFYKKNLITNFQFNKVRLLKVFNYYQKGKIYFLLIFTKYLLPYPAELHIYQKSLSVHKEQVHKYLFLKHLHNSPKLKPA